MTNPNLFNIILVWPILNVLLAIYHIIVAVHIPYALGFSIIILTIVIRLILYPLTASQLKTSQKMQRLTPHLNKLKEKHKNDAKMLQSETMRLYKEHGVNPAAGCLPVIIQLPLIWGLYSVLQQVVAAKPSVLVAEINKIVYLPSLKLQSAWDQSFFGLPLGTAPSHLLNTTSFLILLFPLATALFQFIQTKMMFVKHEPDQHADKKKDDDFASAMQTQSMYIFPIMIGFFSYSLPLGLSLYWNTFTIFGIIQQYQISGWGGIQPWIDKLRGKKNG
ncbi:MAG TPA: YidC/Oxa1 family membrane protein insertase [Patescibacteria group bacterium]